MSIDANPSIKEIATTFGDTPPYSMSELYGLNFSSGNAVVSGTISLSGFSNKTVESMLVESKVLASDGAQNDYFGRSVSISGDGSTAIAGASEHNSRGAAYIFEKVNGTWTQRAKLTASDGATSDYFGHSVSISSDGSTAIMGAYLEDPVNTNQGSAYIFEKPGAGWSDMTETAKINASSGAANDYFGWSVSISSDGSTVLVGAYLEDPANVTDQGSAFIFENVGGTWTQRAKLTASDGAASDHFGRSVSISSDGSTALVGAYRDDTYTGSAYIYEKPGSGWTTTSTHAAKLTASDGATSDYFGWSVSISSDGSTVLVGAYLEDPANVTDQGSAYIYEKPGSGWTTTSTHAAKLTASDGASYDNFGRSVSISGDGSTAIAGASEHNSSRGAAYIFEKVNGTWTQQTKLTSSDGVLTSDYFGYSVSISSDGSTALVGAYRDDVGFYDQGSAYIYESSYFVN